MAVTLVPEDGSSLETANTYQSRAALAAYHADRGNAAWGELSGDEQDVFNLRAADLLDASYAWRGEIASEGQAMRWPRKCVKDRDGREIASDAVPTQIKRAHAELALLLSQGAGVGGSFGSSASSQGPIKSVKADSVAVEWERSATAAAAAPVSNVLPNGAGELLDRILFGLFRSPLGPMIALGKS